MSKQKHVVPCAHCKQAFRKLQKNFWEQKKLAGTDSMTGLPNRRSFTRALNREFARSRRMDVPISLAVLDLDHFKSINDTYGHSVGDSVLERLGKLLRNNSRTSDYVARIGGEEFCIIMPDTHIDGASEHLESLRKKIKEKIRITVDGERLHITASIGVVELEDDENSADFYTRADDALYVAKQKGRDMVMVG